MTFISVELSSTGTSVRYSCLYLMMLTVSEIFVSISVDNLIWRTDQNSSENQIIHVLSWVVLLPSLVGTKAVKEHTVCVCTCICLSMQQCETHAHTYVQVSTNTNTSMFCYSLLISCVPSIQIEN